MITPDSLPEGDDWVFFAVTPRDYEALSHNMAEIRRWVLEAMWRLMYYRGEGDGRANQDNDGAGG